MALDIALNALIKSKVFCQENNKNWSCISQAIPGYTPRQIMHRYEALKQDMDNLEKYSTTDSDSLKCVRKSKSCEPPLPAENAAKALKSRTSKHSISDNLEQDMGPIMVIHVCDEAKNLKQDFHCARDLLIREMKYFCEYLSTDAQRWEEVDISVHCDIQIFDWLMKYIQCSISSLADSPILETNNVISILISSDFLKMEKLVIKCIDFCHQHITAIIATPCNMSCINDKLVKRIAEKFNDKQIDEIRDRKDKFKSKLFAKQIEKLFEVKENVKCENATTLFRCVFCKRLLTDTTMTKMKCHRNRLVVDTTGKLTFEHQRDSSWDVNQHILDLKSSLFNWRDVYWRLWATINYLKCNRCGEYFPCIEYNHCLFHTESVQFSQENNSIVGKYECCSLVALRFDPMKTNNGCQNMDHIIMTIKPEDSINYDDEMNIVEQKEILNILLAHRDVICIPYERSNMNHKDSVSTLVSTDKSNVFQMEEVNGNLRWDLKFLTGDLTGADELPKPQPELHIVESKCSIGSSYRQNILSVYDSDIEEDEEVVQESNAVIATNSHTVLLNAPEFTVSKHHRWDTSRSLRWNQDSQREEDEKKMKQYIIYLTQLRPNSKHDRTKNQREFAGGIYSKLYTQWNSNWYTSRNLSMMGSRSKVKTITSILK